MSEVMTPTEFVLWLNGATSMLEGPPSAEQWTKMQENLHPIIAKMMAEKLLGMAEELQMGKVHKDQIAKIQKEMQYRHSMEIERLKQQLNPSNPGYKPPAPNWQMPLDRGAANINPAWLSNVPPG